MSRSDHVHEWTIREIGFYQQRSPAKRRGTAKLFVETLSTTRRWRVEWWRNAELDSPDVPNHLAPRCDGHVSTTSYEEAEAWFRLLTTVLEADGSAATVLETVHLIRKA